MKTNRLEEFALRSYVRQVLLNEELITVIRGKESKVYDAQFDKDGQLVSAVPRTIDEADRDLVKKIKKFTLAPEDAIYSLIVELGPQQAATDAAAVVSYVNVLRKESEAFKAAMTWNPVGRTGRGEAALKMVFRFSDAPEPDFVSEDGGVRLSVKYFGDDGSGPVKSGQGGVGATSGILGRLGEVLQQSEFGSYYNPAALLADLNKIQDPAERAAAIKECAKIFEKLKEIGRAHV